MRRAEGDYLTNSVQSFIVYDVVIELLAGVTFVRPLATEQVEVPYLKYLEK